MLTWGLGEVGDLGRPASAMRDEKTNYRFEAIRDEHLTPQPPIRAGGLGPLPGPWTIELSSETLAGLFWAMHACSRPLMWHAITMRCRHNARSRRVACDGSLESGAAVLSLQ